jgi:hypothetical protein
MIFPGESEDNEEDSEDLKVVLSLPSQTPVQNTHRLGVDICAPCLRPLNDYRLRLRHSTPNVVYAGLPPQVQH